MRRLDALRETYGDAPAAWYPALTGQLYPGDGEGGDMWIEAAE